MDVIFLILYKKIPEFKLQNYNMTINEFKIIFLVGMGSSFFWKVNWCWFFDSVNLFFIQNKIF